MTQLDNCKEWIKKVFNEEENNDKEKNYDYDLNSIQDIGDFSYHFLRKVSNLYGVKIYIFTFRVSKEKKEDLIYHVIGDNYEPTILLSISGEDVLPLREIKDIYISPPVSLSHTGWPIYDGICPTMQKIHIEYFPSNFISNIDDS